MTESETCECKYCGTKLRAKRSVARRVGPECEGLYAPFAGCQCCMEVERLASKAEGRDFNWDNVTKRTHYQDWKTARGSNSPRCNKRYPNIEPFISRGLAGKTHTSLDDWGSYEDYTYCVACGDQSDADYIRWDDLFTADEYCAQCAKCDGSLAGSLIIKEER